MKKRNFSAEFKRESAQLVVDQNYTVADAAKAMDVGLSWICPYISRHLLSLNPLLARCRRYSRGER